MTIYTIHGSDASTGFLFFEDLKIQWKQAFNPDYVLIDSRTGHTDTGGICTRQLPDCVVAMFYPNEQNLRGLAPVVRDIRNEESGPLKKPIILHFVMGNVPDLDDEDAILSDVCSVSKATLHYEELAATIHHFNSLSMLTQRLFLVDRPKSKIAAEYRQLASAIIRGNLEDCVRCSMTLAHGVKLVVIVLWKKRFERFAPTTLRIRRCYRASQSSEECSVAQRKHLTFSSKCCI
jgi:MinD-like ATPase involved in chromosome partitioning or flagellar assembly